MIKLHTRLFDVLLRGIILVAMASLMSCHSNKGPEAVDQSGTGEPSVSSDGSEIVLPPNGPGIAMIKSIKVTKGSITIPVIVPARVVTSLPASGQDGDHPIFFESVDATSLYADYRQSVLTLTKAEKNYNRIQEMFSNQGATARDVSEAETDVASARSVKDELTSKLRAMGFDPVEIEKTSSATVWIMCDVPESQLDQVQLNEDVDITLSSFPNHKFTGKAVAIGDVVDPVTHTVKVRVTMRNPDGNILPGMFAGVDFGDPIDGILVIPVSSLCTVQGNDYVFIRKDYATFERRRVVLSGSTSTDAIVASGISDGEEVVSAGTMLLKGLSFGY